MISLQLSDDPSRTPHRGDLHRQPDYIARFPGGAPYCSPNFFARWSLLGFADPTKNEAAPHGVNWAILVLRVISSLLRECCESPWSRSGQSVYRCAADSFLGTCELAPDS